MDLNKFTQTGALGWKHGQYKSEHVNYTLILYTVCIQMFIKIQCVNSTNTYISMLFVYDEEQHLKSSPPSLSNRFPVHNDEGHQLQECSVAAPVV